MEIIKTVDDPQGSTETISLSPERQTVPQETMPTGTQLVPLGAKLEPTEARHVSTGAHSMPTEAQLVPTEAQHVSTEAHIMPTESHIIHTEAQHALTEERRHLFQEIKTEYLETQSMLPKIDIEAPGFIQTERFEKYSEPKTGNLAIPGPLFTSSIRRESLMNICSMISMMFDHDSDDSDDVEENNKELDQAALSRLCAVSREIILREEARALSELTIRTVLAEERITLEARRMFKTAIQAAYSAAVVTPKVL